VTEVMPAGAYAALLEFERIARMIPNAPGLADRIALADAAAGRQIAFRAAAGPGEPAESGYPQLDRAMRRTEPRDWWEALVTAYLWPPLLRELFAADAADVAYADAADVADARAESGVDAAWAESRLRSAVEQDQRLADRLLLWGRRLVGEAIALAGEFDAEQFTARAERLAEAHALRIATLFPSPALDL
jgi:hypothetical protein